MTEQFSSDDVVRRIRKLEGQVSDLISNNNKILARQTAMGALLQTLLWGWGKSRKEVGDEILKSGAASLAHVNTLPPEMQQEVVDVWNQGYAKLMGPSPEAFRAGPKPDRT